MQPSTFEEGCTKQVQKGGFCWTHGTKSTHKMCSFEGCVSYAQKGGVCVKANIRTRKQCIIEGCTKLVQKGGVCWTHMAPRLRENDAITRDGCSSYALKGGLDAWRKEGVETMLRPRSMNNVGVGKGGVCITRVANVERKRCSHEG